MQVDDADEKTRLKGMKGMKNVSLKVLWSLVILYATLLGIYTVHPLMALVVVLTLFPVGFILIHGTQRYGLGGILAFLALALVVSNLLENVSILTGFPFGHYHYTEVLGPKLFLVPLLIGPAYVGTGYLAWVLATILVGPMHRTASGFITLAVPVCAACMMTVWDVCFDPTASTLNHWWIWEHGGGFFGVPLTNYLGWFFTVYVFYQLFALFLRVRPVPHRETHRVPSAFDGPAVALYAVIGLSYVLQFLHFQSLPVAAPQVSDVTGTVWSTGAIYETAALMSLSTMLVLAVLAGIKLVQSVPTPAISEQPAASERRRSAVPDAEPVA
jgi:uncharacterized membrane protein